MLALSQDGQNAVQQASVHHGFSQDAVNAVLAALISSHGNMAQFSHSELGGMGQWSRGGMTMIGDMFNNGLKSRVDALCRELSDQVQSQPTQAFTATHQYQSQGNAQIPLNANAFFAADPASAPWWPAELGNPASAGSQNDMRYAYFPDQRRLAVNAYGEVALYDTQDHDIGGFSQQQGGDQSIAFSSQHGNVSLNTLRRVSISHEQAAPPQPTVIHNPPASDAPQTPSGDIFASIERLAALRDKGIVSDREFESKKAELLTRI